MRHLVHRALVMTAASAACLALSTAARASITPSLSLDQSAGKAAGSTANLGLDLKFTNTGTDSAHNLTINLPPGLLANASINGGACLKTTNTSTSACEVGSGTVTADPDIVVLGLPAAVQVPVTFYLVPPPKAGDLAGLTVIGNVLGVTEQLGSTGDIRVRPTGDPNGVGVTINLALPDQLTLSGFTVPLVTISVTEIKSTFERLRYPATCPATPARLGVSADSYSDATVHTLSAPLSVTGCGALTYSPAFKVSATRDSSDRQVSLGTTVTQAATEAPSRSVSLAFPTAVLGPNLQSIQALCLNLSSGTCQTVGSASATSPLYPSTLTGAAYLTGNSSGLSLTLVFPSPFPLTLTGAVDLARNAATFTGLPDIPLTNLKVNLNGGPQGLFLSTCNTPSGTATATLTSQNGDKTVKAPAMFSVIGCPGVNGASGGGRGRRRRVRVDGLGRRRRQPERLERHRRHGRPREPEPCAVLGPGRGTPGAHLQDECDQGRGGASRGHRPAARRAELRLAPSSRQRCVGEGGEDQVARSFPRATHDHASPRGLEPDRQYRARRADGQRDGQADRQGPSTARPQAHCDRRQLAGGPYHHPCDGRDLTGSGPALRPERSDLLLRGLGRTGRSC